MYLFYGFVSRFRYSVIIVSILQSKYILFLNGFFPPRHGIVKQATTYLQFFSGHFLQLCTATATTHL